MACNGCCRLTPCRRPPRRHVPGPTSATEDHQHCTLSVLAHCATLPQCILRAERQQHRSGILAVLVFPPSPGARCATKERSQAYTTQAHSQTPAVQIDSTYR